MAYPKLFINYLLGNYLLLKTLLVLLCWSVCRVVMTQAVSSRYHQSWLLWCKILYQSSCSNRMRNHSNLCQPAETITKLLCLCFFQEQFPLSRECCMCCIPCAPPQPLLLVPSHRGGKYLDSSVLSVLETYLNPRGGCMFFELSPRSCTQKVFTNEG